MKMLRFIAVCLCLTLLSCGFVPRGSVSSQFLDGDVFIDASREVTISDLLREKIEAQGLSVVSDRDNANVLVRLTNERQGQRVVSVQSEGKVSEFELRHTIDLLVIRAPLGEVARYGAFSVPDRVSVRREYTFDDTGILGKADEASILRRELRDELTRQLLLRIIAGA